MTTVFVRQIANDPQGWIVIREISKSGCNMAFVEFHQTIEAAMEVATSHLRPVFYSRSEKLPAPSTV